MLFIFLILIGLIAYDLIQSGKKKPPVIETKNFPDKSVIDTQLTSYISSFKRHATTKDQKELLDKMLSGVSNRELAKLESWNYQEEKPKTAIGQNRSDTIELEAANNLNAAINTHPQVVSAPVKPKAQIQLDNASLLLYFGAFLFVASAGLFVVFAGMPGELRSLVVLMLALVMYFGGIWMYKNKPKFHQAGMAFAGIGIAIAPLVGLAVYNYIFDQSNGSTAWFGTSLLCLAMYTHALFTIRKPLINYIFIFTFLSLFESGVSIINAPIYYFGWVLAGIAIVVTAISKLKGVWPEFQESSRNSGMIFLPISVLVSIGMVSEHGFAQLGVSLLLASAYYGLEAFSTTGETQELDASVSHISLLIGIASIVYSINTSFPIVAITLLILGVIQTIATVVIPESSKLSENFATIALASIIVGVFTGIQQPAVALLSCALLVASAVIVWLRQKRIDGYVLASIALLALTVIFGQIFSTPKISFTLQAVLLTVALFVQGAVLYLHNSKFSETELMATKSTYLISSIVVVIGSYYADPSVSLIVCTLIAFSMLALIKRQNDSDWSVASGLFIAAPLLWAWDYPGIFLGCVMLSLAYNILLALFYRKELNRWISTGLWFLFPLALADMNVFTKWNTGIFAWAYFVVMLCLVLSRAIARGSILFSNKVLLESYTKNASQSYSFGYWISAFLAIVLSLNNGQLLQTSALLSMIAVTVWVLAEHIEKQPSILTLIPVFAQGILITAVNPQINKPSLYVFTLLGSALAYASYFIIFSLTTNIEKQNAVKSGALITAFFTPISVIFFDKAIWTMPLGLIIASSLLIYHLRKSSQENKELTGGLLLVGIYWMMHFFGVRNIQAYTHALVALFAIYAYWRHKRNEFQKSDNYLQLMLATATIPLALQAMNSTTGGIYGWWLILEQVVFFIIGMEIKKKFVMMWGLYVAVGAVLYQLRGLGWAALAFLAIFLIGLAIYKIQKNSDNSDKQ